MLHPSPSRETTAAASAQAADSVALRLIAGCMAGRCAPWPDTAGETVASALLDLGRAHGALPLVHQRLDAEAGWPPALRAAIARQARAEAAVEAVHGAYLARALAALDDAGVPVLVFKGTALAYSVYARPSLRPRDDTDLLVSPRDARCAIEALQRLGHVRARAVSGEQIVHQACLTRTDARGVRVNLDLHWRISNRPRYANALEAGELLARSEPATALAPGARIPCAQDALLLACVHLHGHHREQPRLVWLLDLLLLCEALEIEGRTAAARRAAQLGIEEAIGEPLARARVALGRGPGAPLDALADAFAPQPRTRSRTRRRLDVWREDLAALPGWRARARLLLEHALPSAEYMLARYETRHRFLLPALYLHRAVIGAWRLLRPAP